MKQDFDTALEEYLFMDAYNVIKKKATINSYFNHIFTHDLTIVRISQL